jgi:hypothetical protein
MWIIMLIVRGEPQFLGDISVNRELSPEAISVSSLYLGNAPSSVIARHHYKRRGMAKYEPWSEPRGQNIVENETLSPAKPMLFPALLKVAESDFAERLRGTGLSERLSENDRHFVAVFAASFSCQQLMARDRKL